MHQNLNLLDPQSSEVLKFTNVTRTSPPPPLRPHKPLQNARLTGFLLDSNSQTFALPCSLYLVKVKSLIYLVLLTSIFLILFLPFCKFFRTYKELLGFKIQERSIGKHLFQAMKCGNLIVHCPFKKLPYVVNCLLNQSQDPL